MNAYCWLVVGALDHDFLRGKQAAMITSFALMKSCIRSARFTLIYKVALMLLLLHMNHLLG